jgi:hypothetical protein
VEPQAIRGVAAVEVSRPGQVPGFATEELARFAETHPVPKLMTGDGKAKVTKLDCGQTAKTVMALLRGKGTGLPDSTPVCYVELEGSFALSPPRSAGKPRGGGVALTTAFEVFDAKTGNLLLTGGFTHAAAIGE